MVAEQLVVALDGSALVIGSSVVGVFAGSEALRSGATGVVCALALYLSIVRAGRMLVAAVTVTGLALAVLVPRVTAEVTINERGQREDVIVTAVQTQEAPDGRSTRRCSFARQDGDPIQVAVRRGCQATTTAGERITVLFDLQGVLTPRAAGHLRIGRLTVTIMLALALPVLAFLAVARSYRLPRRAG
jgi:hypothetical protein